MKLNNVLLCCTGSVATIKAPVIINDLKNLGLNVKVIFTKYASHFCSASDIKANEVEIYTDEDEWSTWNKRGDRSANKRVIEYLEASNIKYYENW